MTKTVICAMILVSGAMLVAEESQENQARLVTSIRALKEALARATPGETIVLKNGLYNESFSLAASGKENRPIVVRAETIGGVELQQKVNISGEYLSFVGFHLTGKGGIEVKNGLGCRISRCHMENIRAGKWLTVDVNSRKIEIDHNLIEKKEINKDLQKSAQTMQIRLRNKGESHRIHHNHFRDICKGGAGNGFETLQLITDGNPKDPDGQETGNVIEYNLFERCDGEAEIISVKSNGNILRRNAFVNCQGSLVLRHGHRNIVNGNYFAGGSGGVRMQGRDQVVVNNVFTDLSGHGLAMMNGIGDGFYVRVERALVAHNTFVNCTRPFHIGINHSKYPPGTPPLRCVIANNILYSDKRDGDELVSLVDKKEPEAWTWRDNIFGGVLGVPPREGLIGKNPQFVSNDNGLMLPTEKTPACSRPGIDREELNQDFFVNPRPLQGTVGAVQYIPGNMTGMPITEKDVGPFAGRNNE